MLDQPNLSSPEAAVASSRPRELLDTVTFKEDYPGDVGTISMFGDAVGGNLGRMQNDYGLSCSDYH